MSNTPQAPKRPKEITQHGQTRIDNYFWMRYREDPQVLKYLNSETDYHEEVMQHTQNLQDKLFNEMKARIKEDDVSAPEKNGDFFYYTRHAAGMQYPIYCRKPITEPSTEQVLLDQNALATGKNFLRIGAYSISPDGHKLAYSLDTDGSEKCSLFIKDLRTGKLFAESIENTYGDVYDHYGIEWAADSETFFYLTLDASQRPEKLWRHRLSDLVKDDVLLFHEADETYFLFVFKTRSGKYITTYHLSTTTRETRFLPASQPETELTIIQPREKGHEYLVEQHGDYFYILSNENAKNFKLMRTLVSKPSKENWQEMLPHRTDTLLQNILPFKDYLVLLERRDGLKQIRISPINAIQNGSYIQFPEPSYTFFEEKNPEFESPTLRFSYTSLITPMSVIDYEMGTQKWSVIKEQEIPSGYDKSQFAAERIFATAEDGTQVPISLVYKKGIKLDGSNPCLMYSYGSYGASTDPAFNSNRLSLLERGFVYAIAHIRGGSEMGREWYEAGKMLNKRNTFTDFIACAEHLIKNGYTSTPKLSIMGGSAGGLLVGAAMTLRPDLFGAVIAQVPFVDVINTMSDASIPLTTLEYDQWGNPDNKEYFDYMLSYSPYDNIRATSYPHTLITTGLNDPRVAYWEPAKFTAKLREFNTGKNTILLKTNYDAGHAGASGRYDYLTEIAFNYAFLIDKLGEFN